MLKVCAALLLVACGRVGFDDVGGDPAGGGDGGADGDADAAPPVVNLAFVTSSTQAPGNFGGLGGGDAICMARAAEAGLPGIYVAWLSTAMVDARDRLGGARGWARTDGRPLADTVADVAASRLLHPLRFDERGHDIGSDDATIVVTGTDSDGTVSSNCNDFTSPAATGVYGNPWEVGPSWTNRNSVSCSTPVRLYCFENDLNVPLSYVHATGRRAFVSTTRFSPPTGVAGADAACSTDAIAAGLGDTFRAMIAVSGGAASRFETTGPSWVRVDGIPLASSALAWLSGQADAALDVTATGAYDSSLVITGMDSPLAVTPDMTRDCNHWQMGGTQAQSGFDAATGPRVFSDTTTPCTALYPVYCFE